MKYLTIGQIAKSAGLTVETVRFYESKELIAPAKRTSAGYRQFEPTAVDRLRFIQNAKTLGFTLEEIRQLLSLRIGRRGNCKTVNKKARQKINEIDTKINALQRMKNALLPMLENCNPEGSLNECPILDALEQQEISG